MPTDTFFRLSEAKQARIIQAARQEFADYAYKDASINRIVKAADIPRGSFYQYFSGKADLYQYILDRLSQDKLAYIRAEGPLTPPHSFYDCFLQSIAGGLRWAAADPLAFQIGLRFSLDPPLAIAAQLQRQPALDYYGQLAAIFAADQQAGRIRPEADAGTVLELLTLLGLALQKRYIIGGVFDPADAPRILADFQRYLDTLMLGLSTGGEPHD